MIGSVTALKRYIGITDTSQDTLLTDLLTYVSSEIEALCNRGIEQTTDTEYFDGGSKLIRLHNFPISSVSALEYNAGSESSPAWTAVDRDDYHIDTAAGIITHVSGFPGGTQGLRVKYTGGYATVPSNLEQLAYQMASEEYRRRKSYGVKSESIGAARIDWSKELTAAQRAVIGRYKSINV